MAVGLHSIVYHKDYGIGEIYRITEDKVYVIFGSKQRIFPFPEAFAKEYLLTDAALDTSTETVIPHNNIQTFEREILLDVADNIRYEKIYEAINATVGTSYSGWMKATWPSRNPDRPFRIWFVKLAELKKGELVAAANDCLNTISDDWNEVVYDDLKERSDSEKHDFFQGISLIYAKEPGGSPYIFRGAFINNKDKTTLFHHVYKRIGTQVKLIGNPSNTIEILDDFRK